MNKEQVIEGNKLIAEFMGWEYHKGFLCNPLGGSPLTLKVEELIYHSSWDWLMPAIKKMKDYLQNIERPSRNHCCKGDLFEIDVQCALWEINIEKTFTSFIPLIQWYNQRSK